MARTSKACVALSLSLIVVASGQAASNETDSHKHRVQPTDCWEIHQLGTLGGEYSYAHDVNDSGQVVGNALTEPRDLIPPDPPITLLRPFISAPNGGPITEILAPGFFFGHARTINNLGQVAGDTTIGRSFPVAYFTDPGGGNVQTTLPSAIAIGINNVGQTLWEITFPHWRTVIGPNEETDQLATDLIDLLPPTDDPRAPSVALNDAGQVALNVDGVAYRWSSYEGFMPVAPDADSSSAADMNEAGQIVGTLQHDGVTQAFVTHRHDSGLTLFGKPGDGNQPTGMNNLGQVVGTRLVGSEVHAYVTVPFFVKHSIDLQTLDEVTRDGWSELRPVAINNRGQIAGTGVIDGNHRAFLLSPQSVLAFIPDHGGKHAKCLRRAGQ